MKNKVALMTWYTYRNYGTALQASALTKIISDLNYEVKIISYKPRRKSLLSANQALMPFLSNVLGSIKKKIKKNTSYNPPEREKLFKKYFDERITETSVCNTYPELYELNNDYDAFVCGSDQIWSPLNYEDKYFLTFVEDQNKLIAYAPSFGVNSINNEEISDRIKDHISRFTWLSTRELQGRQIIKGLIDRDAEVVLDPTLLLTANEWDQYVDTKKLINEDYLLCYFLGNEKKYLRKVKQIAKLLNKKICLIPTTKRQAQSKYSIPFAVGPNEFVSLVKNANYVCTDSFHGMVMSVNYNVPFSVFKRFEEKDVNNQNSRILSFLKLFCLENRLVDGKNKHNSLSQIDCCFLKTNEKLDQERKKSMDYLKNAIESAVNSKTDLDSKPFKITDMCCGCGACVTVCSKGAITIKKDENGFEHYRIDSSKCVRCGQCKNVCPMANISAANIKDSLNLYSVKSQSNEVLKKSSSGGVGHELALHLLNEGYAVCGCAYETATNSAKHIWILPEEKEKLPLLQGSKYIQSITSNAFSDISLVAQKHKIAFFGTPCQSAAVDKLLRKKGLREKAIIIDLICHGVPSYHLWEKYLSELDKKYGTGKHPTVLFRSKERKWAPRLLLVKGNNSEHKKEEHKDDFYAFFRRGLCDMGSCFDCPYRERSSADLRIGDYWGKKFENDKQGVSMVIANTLNGEEIINILSQKKICQVQQQDLSEYWSIQCPHNQQKPLIWEQLINELKSETSDLHILRKKYCRNYDIWEYCSKIYQRIKRWL